MNGVMRRDELPASLATGLAGEPAPPPEPGDGSADAIHVRTVWISDLHLGTPGCQADGPARLPAQRRMRDALISSATSSTAGSSAQWYWPQAHNDVVQKLLRKARKGTRVVFVPGNHDEFARKYLDHNFGGIDVVETMSTRRPTGAGCGSRTATCSTA